MNTIADYSCFQEHFDKMKLGNLYVAKQSFKKIIENELYLLTNIEFLINNKDLEKYFVSGYCVRYTFLNGKDFYDSFFSLKRIEKDIHELNRYNHITKIHEYFELFSEDTYE